MLSAIKSLFTLKPREKLPRLRNSLSTSFDLQELPPDIELILLTGRVKDPESARRLMEKYGVDNAPDLLKLLPKRRINWRRKLGNMIMRLEGSQATNPYLKHLQPDNEGKKWVYREGK